MPTPTYDLIVSSTVATLTTSVTFSSLPSTGYQDLVVVINGTAETESFIRPRFNSDSGNNYSMVRMEGNTAGNTESTSSASASDMIWGKLEDNNGLIIAQIFDYLATDKHKSLLVRSNAVQEKVEAFALRYASTSAISSIEIRGTGTGLEAGTVISIYGIAA